jgi:hypothetical protein
MKKWIALVLVFLLSAMSVAAAAEEIDFSSYTEAELRELRTQIDSEISRRSFNDETAEAVCLAFVEYMQELGHPVEYTTDLIDDSGFQLMRDTDLKSKGITVVLMSGGYEVMLKDDLYRNIPYIRDCMVAMAMAVAQVEGVEIFHNEIGTATRSCVKDFPDDLDSDILYWYWPNSYGYNWTVRFREETTVVAVN